MTETELVRTLQQGHGVSAAAYRKAVEELLSKSYPWVTRMCLFELRNREHALDCAQEAMVEVAKSLSAFQGRSELKTWMFIIVKRTIYRYRRKEMTHGRRFLVGLVSDIGEAGNVAGSAEDEQESTDELLELSESQRELLKHVRALPNKQRHAVLLHYFEDMSLAEVARRLNCSENSCKTHLFRARKKLATVLLEKPESGSRIAGRS